MEKQGLVKLLVLKDLPPSRSLHMHATLTLPPALAPLVQGAAADGTTHASSGGGSERLEPGALATAGGDARMSDGGKASGDAGSTASTSPVLSRAPMPHRSPAPPLRGVSVRGIADDGRFGDLVPPQAPR